MVLGVTRLTDWTHTIVDSRGVTMNKINLVPAQEHNKVLGMGEKENDEGVNSTIIYYKNFGKGHNVLPVQ
jgi:hypothetical protein